MSLTVNAPAKINLYLHITGKRSNGYHLLDSLCVFTDIADRITLKSADDLSLTITGPFAHTIAHENPCTNLAWRAAQGLSEASGRHPGVAITLEKNIPPGAGLGGGSSDAAATVKGLEQLWNTRLTDDAREHLLQSLGSDVSACYEAVPLVMRGVGDIILPAPGLPDLPLVVVYPDKPSSTPAAYKNYTGPFSAEVALPSSFKDVREAAAFIGRQKNDLRAPAIMNVPEIESALDSLSAQDGILLPQMSGSGSACFGIFETAAHAERAATAISSSYPRWWVRHGGLSSRH